MEYDDGTAGTDVWTAILMRGEGSLLTKTCASLGEANEWHRDNLLPGEWEDALQEKWDEYDQIVSAPPAQSPVPARALYPRVLSAREPATPPEVARDTALGTVSAAVALSVVYDDGVLVIDGPEAEFGSEEWSSGTLAVIIRSGSGVSAPPAVTDRAPADGHRRRMITSLFDVACGIEVLINARFSPEDLAQVVPFEGREQLQTEGPRVAALFRAVGAACGDDPAGEPVGPAVYLPFDPDDREALRSAVGTVYDVHTTMSTVQRVAGPNEDFALGGVGRDEVVALIIKTLTGPGRNPRAVKLYAEEAADYLDRLLAAVSASKDR